MLRPGIDKTLIGARNESAFARLQAEYDTLGEALLRRGIDIDEIKENAVRFGIAMPSWGVSSGGIGPVRFPGPGEPRNILDRLDDCTVVHQLTGATPRVSLNVARDRHDDPSELRDYATVRGLSFDAMIVSPAHDALGQEPSFKYGSLSHVDPHVREQAVANNLASVDFGKAVGAIGLVVRLGDRFESSGQGNVARAFERCLESARAIYAGLPGDWRLFAEHGGDGAGFLDVIPDWGASHLIVSALGERAFCLVDLAASRAKGTAAVARLVHLKKLGRVHFGDQSDAADPYGLFLVENEIANAESVQPPEIPPRGMIDQSRNVADPVEGLAISAMAVARAYLQAHLVDREILVNYQDTNDALMASETLKLAFRTDVEPILAMARHDKGAAIEPIATYRASGYRQKVADLRPKPSSIGAL